MKRIALRLPASGVWTGGVNYLATVCRALLAHSEVGVEPLVFHHPDTSTEVLDVFSFLGERLISDARVLSPRNREGMAGALLLGRNAAMKALCADHRCDVVFEAADFLGWRFPIPCLAWVPDFQDRHLPHLFSTWNRRRRAFGLQLQLMTGRTVLLSSEDARQDCVKFYPASAGRTAVARFAVTPSLQPGASDPGIARAHGLPNRFFYLPNQYWLHKNHLRVIEALAEARGAGIAIVVASSGNPRDPLHADHYSRLQQRVAELGLADQFVFLGSVASTDVAKLMRAAIAVVNPSLFEGWSTTVEEAKSLGARMVLSNLKVHREQAPPNAVYFDPNDTASIALALGQVWREDAVSASLSVQQSAAADAEIRIGDFARQFAEACDAAIERFNADQR